MDNITLADELEALIAAATKGDLSTAEHHTDGKVYECPVCGDGEVDAADYCNFDSVALGVQFYGIGNEFGAHEKLWRWFTEHRDTILAALRTPAPAPVGGGVVEALRQARDDLLAVGNDYPGSSCQKWCTERAKAAWDTLRPWEHCPSTHCERTQECRSVNECSANKSTVAALQAQPAQAQGDDVVELIHELNNLPMVSKGSQFDGWLLSEATLKSILAAMQQQAPVKLDWHTIAKAAGEHGVRYRTNSALMAFFAQIGLIQPQPDAAVAVERERCARIAEKRAEDRFAENGITEPDTNDSYYSGRAAELYDSLDEEDWAIAADIRAGGHPS